MEPEEFYNSLGRMAVAVENNTLVNEGIAASDHNETARVLRNGLAVTSFAHLESFLQRRFEYLANSFASSSLPYSEFPDLLKKFFTTHSVQGLVNRTYFLPKGEQRSYSETHLTAIAGFNSNPQTLTALGFSPKGSNVLSEDLRAGLAAFGVAAPWEHLKNICNSMGAGALDLSAAYSNINRTRNSAAHDAASDIPTGNLKGHLREILDIACSTHVVIAHLSLSVRRSVGYNRFEQALGLGPQLRFIDLVSDGRFVERPSLDGRAIKLFLSLGDAIVTARARSENPVVVVRDLSSRPIRVVDAL